jgi:hypothetical protein
LAARAEQRLGRAGAAANERRIDRGVQVARDDLDPGEHVGALEEEAHLQIGVPIAPALVAAGTLGELVRQIPAAAYAKYPNLSRDAVEQAVEDFLSELP